MTTTLEHLHPQSRVATRADRRSHLDRAPKGIARSTETAAGPDISPVAIHEAGHAVVGRQLGFEIETVSIRTGLSHAGITIANGPHVDLTSVSALPWWLHPDLAAVVRKLYYALAGAAAEALTTDTGRVALTNADDARAAFAALPVAKQRELLAAEAATDGVSDSDRAWAVAVAFAGVEDATMFFDLVAQGARRYVSDSIAAILAVAFEVQRGSVLDGAAIDVIRAVGELIEADEGPPRSGMWTPLTTCHIAGVDDPARMRESYPWHDARVQVAAQLFLPADAPADVIEKAIDDYRAAAQSPAPARETMLRPGPGVRRASRRLIGRTRDGVPFTVARGHLARADVWYVVQWPGYFEPSVGSDEAPAE